MLHHTNPSLAFVYIEHSDPEVLKEQAHQELTPDQIAQKRLKMKKVLKEMDEKPSEGMLMTEIIDGLRSRGLNISDSKEISADIFSLEFLKELVEPIDNANDLDKMGGLNEVLLRIDSKHPDIRNAAYHVLGTAASNNDLVQKQVLEKGGLRQLARRLKVEDKNDSKAKALYAIGTVARNDRSARQILYEEKVPNLLLQFMQDEDTRIRRKSISLLTDFFSSDPDIFPKSIHSLDAFVIPLIEAIGESQEDLDMREKAMTAIHTMVTVLLHERNTIEILRVHNTVEALKKFQNDLKSMEDTEDPFHKMYLADLNEMADNILMHIEDVVKRRSQEF